MIQINFASIKESESSKKKLSVINLYVSRINSETLYVQEISILGLKPQIIHLQIYLKIEKIKSGEYK